MADDQKLEQMKQKYASVLNTVKQQNVSLSHVHIQDGKFFIQGTAPSEEAKNKVWDQIKLVNPDWQQELVADIDVNASAASAPAAMSAGAGSSGPGHAGQTYTVESGDTLSKISQRFYGNAASYQKIFEANRNILSDPDKIKPGQVLTIPS